MRLNKFLALYGNLSRRSADKAIEQGRVIVNDQPAKIGQDIAKNDQVLLDNKKINATVRTQTIILNKPVGYVCSRNGQGSRTIYDLLPIEFYDLKPAGRLDKDSSGLVLLTNDGQLANRLTHPRYGKTKTYEVKLSKELTPRDFRAITTKGISLSDGISKLKLTMIGDNAKEWKVEMTEGRNRQIRRTFAALNYNANQLHRIQFGDYRLEKLPVEAYKILSLLY